MSIVPPPRGHDLRPAGPGGMLLRDWFAGQAMVAAFEVVARDPTMRGKSTDELNAFIAALSWNAADALMATRRTTQP